MDKFLRALIIVCCLTAGLIGVPARSLTPSDQTKQSEQSETPAQRAIFAVFVASQGQLDTALSISNTLSAPPGMAQVFEEFPNREGTLEFYFWHASGNLVFYETEPASPGAGLTSEGMLRPGQTYRVLLSEILEAANYREIAVELGLDPDEFTGYAWIVANFDGVQGTVTVTDFSSWSQTAVMQPDLGSTFFDFDANAGVPLSPPKEDD